MPGRIKMVNDELYDKRMSLTKIVAFHFDDIFWKVVSNSNGYITATEVYPEKANGMPIIVSRFLAKKTFAETQLLFLKTSPQGLFYYRLENGYTNSCSHSCDSTLKRVSLLTLTYYLMVV
jgi:hypothetical protein